MICIVAFSDDEGNSLAYKKFKNDQMQAAVDFYAHCLRNPSVNVVSTRKTVEKIK